MNKWFNKQKPLTLGFITGISCFIIGVIFSYFIDAPFDLIKSLKFIGIMSTVMFLMAWGSFSMGEKSSIIFDEIESLYFRAKKAKTKTELIVLESDYRVLRKKAQHQGHYTQLNTIIEIIELKKEFL